MTETIDEKQQRADALTRAYDQAGGSGKAASYWRELAAVVGHPEADERCWRADAARGYGPYAAGGHAAGSDGLYPVTRLTAIAKPELP